MKGERNRLFNNDRDVFTRLAQFLSGLQQDDEQDDEDSEFDDDEHETTDQTGASSNDIQVAVKAYLAAVLAGLPPAARQRRPFVLSRRRNRPFPQRR